MLIDDTENEKWQSCCSNRTTDSHLLKYVTQLGVSLTVLGFSMTQIIRDVGNKEIYFSLISFVVGVYLPSPSHKKD
jgi:hypothetical protein